MQNKIEITPVIFRVFNKKKDVSEGTEVIALFPTLPGDRNLATCGSYMRIGQHGSASVALFYEGTRPAKINEYQALMRELEGRGYNLRVYKRYAPRFTAIRLGALNGKG